jgi:TorA maturation chaperone TorD
VSAAAQTTSAATAVDPAHATQQRSNIYGFLATVFRTEVTAELLHQLREPEFSSALAAAGVTLDDDFLDRPDDEVLDDLAVEYSRLFVGPGRHIPPYASVHTEADGGDLCGRSTGRLREFIAAAGLAYENSYTGLADHISVELECMARLTARLTAAETAGRSPEVARCRELECVFVEQFLAPWVPQFCRKVADAARSSFYREMAALTAAFIASERQAPASLQ